MDKKKLTQRSFTLIEILVVISIISLLSAIVFANYRAGESQLALQRSASKLAQDIRRAQEMAMAAREIQGAPSSFQKVYGIYFPQVNSSDYILFADLDNKRDYNSGEEIEILSLEKNVKINNLSPPSPLTITFTPPDPTVTINNDSNQSAEITITNNNQTKKIKVNKAGLIYVE